MINRYLHRYRKMFGTFAAVALIGMAAGRPAHAGSSTLPGLTMGFPLYLPFPNGVTFVNLFSDAQSNGPSRARVIIEATDIVYQSPFKILGGRLLFVGTPVLTSINAEGAGGNVTGLFNTYIGAQLTWSLAKDLGIGWRLGGYIPQGNSTANHWGVIEQRFGESYIFRKKLEIDTNFEFGIPTASSDTHHVEAPRYFNTDLSVLYHLNDRFSIGPIGYETYDLNKPRSDYKLQHAVAVGGDLRYYYGKGVINLKITTEVIARNTGGRSTRGYFEYSIHI